MKKLVMIITILCISLFLGFTIDHETNKVKAQIWFPTYEGVIEFPEMHDAGCAMICMGPGSDCYFWGQIPVLCDNF